MKKLYIENKVLVDKKNSSYVSKLDSNVMFYGERFPEIFISAVGHIMTAKNGKNYLDFLSGAGALNYGHNHPRVVDAILNHVSTYGIIHALDFVTTYRNSFIEAFNRIILEPRKLKYKFMFPGPTGTNAVEAALKLARKYTKRSRIIAFEKSFHGMTLGSLSVTGIGRKREGAGCILSEVSFCNFEGKSTTEALAYIVKCFSDLKLQGDLPAAIIIETIQGEGGLNVVPDRFLTELRQICEFYGTLFIVDDIQAGCGRTGSFFSFERVNLYPDIVCLSKSLSGSGLPLSLLLIRPNVDVWNPAEHNGTFRSNNLALITGEAILDHWRNGDFEKSIVKKSIIINNFLTSLQRDGVVRKGIGMLQGLAFKDCRIARRISEIVFEKGLIVETCGINGEVLKIMPPLNIDEESLIEGLNIIKNAINKK